MGEGTRTWPRLSSRAGGSKPTLEPEARGRSRYFQTRRANSAVALDKVVLLKAALEWRLRSAYPVSRIYKRLRIESVAPDLKRHPRQSFVWQTVKKDPDQCYLMAPCPTNYHSFRAS